MRSRGVFFAIALVLSAGLVGATSLVKMDFGDLSRDADSVIVGTVVDVTGEWDPSLTFIHSNVTINVERTLAGPASDRVVLRTPGGWIGGEGQKADGVAEFTVGEKVLVFLTQWEDGTPKVLGYVQGKSRIIAGADGRERLLGGSGHGLALETAEIELTQGPNFNIQLRPAR